MLIVPKLFIRDRVRTGRNGLRSSPLFSTACVTFLLACVVSHRERRVRLRSERK
jgi:hypothetical protein